MWDHTEGCHDLDLVTRILGLTTAVVGLIAAAISLRIALRNRRELGDLNKRLQRVEDVPTCIQGPTHIYGKPGHVDLRVKLRDPSMMATWWLVAVCRNAPDSVWVQQMDHPTTTGYLSLQAYQFKGRYAVYAARDDDARTVIGLQELQARAAHGQAATLHDLPKGAILVCDGVA